ncbi:hypothetical protein BV898_14132 [Hypsibius exemplaris]|uniref:Uncharacterized protein n=1 Tax=Hypsibius exemplaris TaxID=2072580 RepID=A0A1W0W8M7_HYPEX|nr:hypothetical protein BV898_14132 [Hypsibius exemplaris]
MEYYMKFLCLCIIFMVCGFVNVNAIPNKAAHANSPTHVLSRGPRTAAISGKKQVNPPPKKQAARVASVTGVATPGTQLKTTTKAFKLPTQRPL